MAHQCPVCQTATLNEITLETDLPAWQCHTCHGLWISANDYLVWLKTLADEPQHEPVVNEAALPGDSHKAVICPDCGHILRRYKIWPNVSFHLDRCATCNGVWFDQHEWDALKIRGWHKQVNAFFTRAWQENIREEEVRARLDKMYEERFGAEDYGRIREIRQWLTEHPKGIYLLAYLTDKDPYRI